MGCYWCYSSDFCSKPHLDDSRYACLFLNFKEWRTDKIPARLVNGWGTGMLNAIVPVWATETAEHKSRGQFVAIEFTLNIFGVVVAYWIE